MNRFITGYYARGTTQLVGKVHVHDSEEGHPVCGSRPAGSFLWCAFFIMRSYVTCGHCLRWLDRRASARAKRRLTRRRRVGA